MPADRTTRQLGLFQRTMVLWNEMHPYNAVHVARLQKRGSLDELAEIVRQRLAELGLGQVALSADGRSLRIGGSGADVEFKTLDAAGDVPGAVQAEVRRQINTPFPVEGSFLPVRFFAADAGDSVYLGVAYCHFISDASLPTALLTDIAAAYAGRAGRAALPLRWTDSPLLLLPALLRHAPACAVACVRQLREVKRSVKVHYADPVDGANGLSSFTLDREHLAALVESARQWGVTLNDVFLAALVKSVAPMAASRMSGSRRKRIAVSSIVSARGDVADRFSRHMGMLLGSFSVFQDLPGDAPLSRVARSVRRRTAHVKKHKLYLGMLSELALCLLIMPQRSIWRRQRVYYQYYPQWGGITNVNMNPLTRSWRRNGIVDYFRAVSTGPICPIVLSATTYDGVLNVEASYRTTVFSAEAIGNVLSEFSRCLSCPQ